MVGAVSLKAAIVTVGSELTMGLRVDTNTAEIARTLVERGFSVVETLSVGDSVELLAEQLARLTERCQLVVTTGGLGPTHDDITRQAASMALSLPLVVDPGLVEWLQPVVARHSVPAAAAQVLVQAEVLEGARIIPAATGTAPGLIATAVNGCVVALLPGPPSEMRPMLEMLAQDYPVERARADELGVVGMTESDAQQSVSVAIEGYAGIGFTVLARPGDVRVLLTDEGAGADVLAHAVDSAVQALGDSCYTRTGRSLAEEVLAAAKYAGLRLAVAESCTGGMVATALTDAAGASDVFAGGAVTYSNDSKVAVLGVSAETIASHGAVSERCVIEMAEGARRVFSADVAVAVSGVAGPDGGTAEKPVGTVWFGVTGCGIESYAFRKELQPNSRSAVRMRATAAVLDLMRRAVQDARHGA